MTTRFFALALPLLLALGVLPQAMGDVPRFNCPEASLGETQADCPWAAIARELSEAPAGTRLDTLLRQRAPSLHAQVSSERSSSIWHSLWGYSINFDELARGLIVNTEILKMLYSLSGIRPPQLPAGSPDNIQHAGLEHTYGYLFSVLKTSFGYKRARWVSGEINRGFGFTTSPISPTSRAGSLFGNVTYFIGRIAFRHDLPSLAVLQSRSRSISPELIAVGYGNLKITRLEETLELERGRKVVLRTDLVPFPIAPPASAPGAPAPNDTLLIYSFVDGGVPRLISAFPVTASFGGGILKPETLGANQPIVTRYNAYIPGVTGRTDLRGTRIITETANSR